MIVVPFAKENAEDDALLGAIFNDDIASAREAFDAGANPNALDRNKKSMLANACRPEGSGIFELLLERGADPFGQAHPFGGANGILHAVARKGWLGTVVDLIGRGVDVNETTSNGGVALHWAAEAGHLEVCRALLDHGADPSIAIGPSSSMQWSHFTALHFAAYNDQPAVCRLLVERGANLYATAEMGAMPLHIAGAQNAIQACHALVALGATPSDSPANLRHDWYLTPFQYTVEKGGEAAARMFVLEHGESLRQKTLGGKTIAQLARKHDGLYQRLLTCARSEVTQQKLLAGVCSAESESGAGDAASKVSRPKVGSSNGML